MHLPHARRQEPLSMRQPKFKSWPAWHKRLQLAIHLEYARAPFFFLSGDQAAQETCRRGTELNQGGPQGTGRGVEPTNKPNDQEAQT